MRERLLFTHYLNDIISHLKYNFINIMKERVKNEQFLKKKPINLSLKKNK